MVARIVSVLFCTMVLVGTSQAQAPLYKCVVNGVATYQQIQCQGKAVPASLKGGSHVVAPAIEGTWKIDKSTIHLPTKPIDLLVQDGKFECKSCEPPIAVKADGSDQTITGLPASNTIAVKVLDARSIQQTRKKYGRVVSVETMTVSVDWKTATLSTSNHTLTATDNSTINLTRSAIGPASSHEVSGSWKETSVADIPDSRLFFTYQVQGQMVSKSTPSGEAYTANLDGTVSPSTSDDGSETIALSIKAIGNNTLEETRKRNGKVVNVQTLVVDPNGKTMTITDKNTVEGTTLSMVAIRQ